MQVLRTFAIPSIKSLQQKSPNEPQLDPHEIDIDDEDDNCELSHNEIDQTTDLPKKESTSLSFLEFGVGPLHLVPFVRLYFPGLSDPKMTENFVAAADILYSLSSSEFDFSCVNLEELENHLCSEFNVSSLTEVGIVICGDLKLELVMLNHVHSARMKLLVDVQNNQLQEFAFQERKLRESATNAQKSKNENRHFSSSEPTGKYTSSTNRLEGQNVHRIPTLSTSRAAVSSFVSQCAEVLSDSPYSPSFGKALDAVEKVSKSKMQSKYSEKNSKKRARGKGSTEAETAEPSHGIISNDTVTLREIAAEYIMLHLGGEKYRAKRFNYEKNSAVEVEFPGECSEGGQRDCVGLTQEPPTCLASMNDDNIDENVDENTDKNKGDKTAKNDKDHIAENNNDDENTASSKVTASVHSEICEDSSAVTGVIAENESVTVKDIRVRDYQDPNDARIVLQNSIRIDNNTIRNDSDSAGKYVSTFECKIFSPANIIPMGRQKCASVYSVSNENLSDLTPWCVSESISSSDLRAVGRWGEALVYQYLLLKSKKTAARDVDKALPPLSVEWLNKEEETRAGYDLITREIKNINSTGLGAAGRPNSITETTYVEVKTSRFDDLNTFEISLWEWEFATANPRVRYHIYRVYNAGNPSKVRIVVVEDVLEMITARKIRLCLSI